MSARPAGAQASGLLLAALTLLAACTPAPRTIDRKEIFVEPFRDADYELARLYRVSPFPFAPRDEARSFSITRPFDASDQRMADTRRLLAGSLEPEDDDPTRRPDPTRLDRPPTTLIFPDRTEARNTSCVYVGHSAFLERSFLGSGAAGIHHVRVLVVNRERVPMSVPIAFFQLQAATSGESGGAIPLVLAATDRNIRIPEAIEVPRGEQRLAHFFFREKSRISPILTVNLRAEVESPDGPRTLDLRSELVRRYVVEEGILSPLEDRVARGILELPNPSGTRDDWIDPGLSAVPGSGK